MCNGVTDKSQCQDVCRGQACFLMKCFGSGKFWSGCDDGCVGKEGQTSVWETANIVILAAAPGRHVRLSIC